MSMLTNSKTAHLPDIKHIHFMGGSNLFRFISLHALANPSVPITPWANEPLGAYQSMRRDQPLKSQSSVA